MDRKRLNDLAGISNTLTEQCESSIKELELLEREFQGKYNLDIDTEQVSVEDIQRRFDAASRALGLANRIRDPEYKKKHLSRIMSNMNTIRAALQHMIKQVG